MPKTTNRAGRIALLVALATALVVSPAGAFEAFVGTVHEHSGYSDGIPGTAPRDYFASGKAFGLDFMGSGEHSDNADLPITFSEECLDPEIARCALADDENPLDSFRKWDATAEQADAATDETFTAFRGFEWTNDRHGHINVYFSQHDTNAKADGGYAALELFWRWLTTPTMLGGGADGLATFNHPGREDDLEGIDTGFTWNDFAWIPEADDRMVGIEVYNRGSDYGSRGPAPGWYAYALSKGWHLGAIGAEDGHVTNWGTPETGKTVLLAPDRSRESLREAMLARRFYAVGPNYNDVRVEMDVDGEPVGSRLARVPGSVVPVDVALERAGVPWEATIELVSGNRTGEIHGVVDSATAAAASFEITAPDEETWFYLRVISLDDGFSAAYTSPVWIGPAAP